MDLKEAKEKCKELLEHNYLEDLGYLRVENHYIKFNTAIETILQELDNLQKENDGKDCIIETLDHNEKVKDKYIKYLEEKAGNNIHKYDIELHIKLIEGGLETLEKYNINHWENHFAYVAESTAIRNMRRLVDEVKDLLKEE